MWAISSQSLQFSLVFCRLFPSKKSPWEWSRLRAQYTNTHTHRLNGDVSSLHTTWYGQGVRFCFLRNVWSSNLRSLIKGEILTYCWEALDCIPKGEIKDILILIYFTPITWERIYISLFLITHHFTFSGKYTNHVPFCLWRAQLPTNN